MEVLNSQGNLLTLHLADDLSGIFIQDVGGLDPVTPSLISSSIANRKGADYEGSTTPPRNITMVLNLVPYPDTNTVRGLRNQINSFFDPASSITMTFYDDEMDDGLQISGIVESCLSPRMVQKPVVNISVMCYDPDFVDMTPVIITGMTTADISPTAITYEGTASTGIVLTLNVNRTMSEFSLYYVDPAMVTWTLDFGYNLLAGDVVTISTVENDEYATLLRAGTVSSVVSAISLQSTWPQISPGSNSLRISADGDPVPATVEFTTRYGSF